MKHRLSYRNILAVVLLLIGMQQVNARSEYTRVHEKSFSLSQGGTVDLDNIHGDIEISTWEKNEVSIKVTVRVMANSDSNAETAFDRINISFNNASNRVSAETEIDSKKSFWWFMQSWWGDDDVRIDYVVYMPESANLEVDNRYGAIEVEEILGESQVVLKYGDLTMDHAGGKLNLDLAYGNGTVASATDAIVGMAYFKLRINEAKTIEIDSKFSQLTVESVERMISTTSYDGYHLGEVGVMKNDGKYDKIDIDRIDELDIDTKYTSVKIDVLVKSMEADLSYGGIDVEEIREGFDHIRVESKYTGVKLETDGLKGFKFDVRGRYASVKLPPDVEVMRDIRENNHIEVSGHKGSANTTGSIVVDAEYGGIKL